MYHRNIVGVNAAKYTRESPLPISNGGTFNSTAAAFSATLKANKTYYYDAECDGYMGKWMKAKDGASGKLMRLYLVNSDGSVRTVSGKPGAFTPTADGTYYFEVQSADSSLTMHVWNFSVVEYSDKVEYAPNPDAVDAGSGEIKIYRPKSKQTEVNGSALGIFPLLSTSVHKKEFMGSDYVTLQWDETCVPSEEVLSIPLGSYIMLDGMKFRCLTQYTPQQSDELTWHYEVEFHAPVSALSVKPFFFYMDDLCETEFSINGEFKEFTDALVTAIYKSTGETWTIIAPDDLGTQALTFSQATIFDALGDIADAFGVEWMATENSITFIKDATSSSERTFNVGIDIAAPSSSNSDEEYYNRYYAFGSTRNIVKSDYSTLNASVTSLSEARLKLPTSSWTDSDGVVYPACPYGYVDYADGSSTDDLERNACVKVYDDIYPQSDLEVTEVSTTTKKNDDGEPYPVYTLKMKATSDGSVFKVENSTYNKDGNPDGMLISGLTISINFTSGLLQGKEFELSLSANGKEFTIVPDTSEDIMVPNDLIIPQVGDKCIIFNIRMPDSYRASAEHKLYKKLMEDIATAHSSNAELTLTSYPTAGIASIDVADKILIKNGKQTISTRVASFEQCLDLPSSWTITTGNGVQTSKVKTLTETINDVKGVATTASKAGVLANRAAYKASQELIEQVFDPEGDFFTETIKPLVVQTANVTVGTKSQQFVLDNLIFGFSNGESENVAAYFYASARDSSITPSLHHYAIDPDNVRTWNFDKSYKVSYGGSTSTLGTAFSFSADTAGCYIYAVCPRFDGVDASTELNGTLLLTDQQILVEPASDNDNYYFLLGMLSSEITTNGFISRNVTLTYGETAINGRNITTGRITSTDGTTYFDLDTGEIRGNIEFNASEDNTALINNIINANTIVAGAASSATSALSTAKEALAKAEEAAGEVNPNLLRGTEYMRIGDGTWESASFRHWSGQGTLSSIDNSKLSSFTGEDTPSEIKTAGLLITPNKYSTDTTYTREKSFFQETYNSDCDTAEGDTVTMSAYVWASQGPMRWRYIQYGDGSFPDYSGYINQGWNKVTLTVTQPATPRGSIFYYRSSNTFTEQPYMIWANIKLEKGTEATAWCEANEDKNYLKEAIAEATQGTTTLGGGLVLSKYMGVRDSSGVIVAGMSGTSQATAGTLPMIWAGATANTSAAIQAAPFRVYNGGHVDMGDVSITQGSGTKTLTISNGTITSLNSSKKSVFSSDTMGSISTAVSSSATTTSKTITAGNKSLYAKQIETSNKQAETISSTGTYSLTSYTTTKAAALSIPAFSVTFYVDCDDISHSITSTCTNDSWLSGIIAIVLKVGTTAYTLANGDLTDNLRDAVIKSATLSVSAQNITVPASTSIQLYISYAVTGKIFPWEQYDADYDRWEYFDDAATEDEVKVNFPSAVTLTIKEGEYRNSYYADGFFLQSASTQYAGINSFDSSTLMQMRTGNALFKFTANGLLQSMNGGNAFYRVSPVVMAFSINYNSTTNKYTIGSHYNPFGKTMGDINRDSAGKITVNHNYGDWTFTFATAIDATYSVFCKVVSFTSTSVTIGRIDRDGNYRDGNFQVMLFDFHTY